VKQAHEAEMERLVEERRHKKTRDHEKISRIHKYATEALYKSAKKSLFGKAPRDVTENFIAGRSDETDEQVGLVLAAVDSRGLECVWSSSLSPFSFFLSFLLSYLT